jgi:hypothetical protein
LVDIFNKNNEVKIYIFKEFLVPIKVKNPKSGIHGTIKKIMHSLRMKYFERGVDALNINHIVYNKKYTNNTNNIFRLIIKSK